MLFLVIFEAHDLGYVFPSPTVSDGSRGEASVFSTLVPLLIQTSIYFLLSLSLFVGDLAASSGRGVERLRYQRRRRFFNGVVVGVSGGGGL